MTDNDNWKDQAVTRESYVRNEKGNIVVNDGQRVTMVTLQRQGLDKQQALVEFRHGTSRAWNWEGERVTKHRDPNDTTPVQKISKDAPEQD